MARVNKRAYVLAAQVAGGMSEMDSAASKVEASIRGEAAKHRVTGDFAASIKTAKGRLDRYVYTDAPEAWSIEFGHRARDGSHVPGTFIFTNGARKAAGG